MQLSISFLVPVTNWTDPVQPYGYLLLPGVLCHIRPGQTLTLLGLSNGPIGQLSGQDVMKEEGKAEGEEMGKEEEGI